MFLLLVSPLLVAPLPSSDLEVNDMGKECWDIQDKAHHLETEVKSTGGLLALFGTGVSVFTEPCEDSNQTGNNPEWQVDSGEEIEQRQEVYLN